MTNILNITGLSVSYGSNEVLKDINFILKSGSVTAITGRNGCGKTTLFKSITGQVKPAAGEIQFANRNLIGLPSWRRARNGIAWTAQSVSSEIHLTPMELLGLATNSENQNNLVSLLPAISPVSDVLLNFIDRPWKNLSFGQRKLVSFAVSANTAPDLLLLDEPVAGLSPKFVELIAESIASLASLGTIIAYIEHNHNFIQDTAEEVAVLAEGRFVHRGHPNCAFDMPHVIEALI